MLEGAGIDHLACAHSLGTLCVFSELTASLRQVIFSAFDPINGRGKELRRIGAPQPLSTEWYPLSPEWYPYGWDLSQDGSRLAFTLGGKEEDQIQILPLDGGEDRVIKVSGWSGLGSPSWAADGRGLYVSPTTGSATGTVLYVDLGGHADVIWRSREPGFGFMPRVSPSPDGRHLAVPALLHYTNVWLLENF